MATVARNSRSRKFVDVLNLCVGRWRTLLESNRSRQPKSESTRFRYAIHGSFRSVFAVKNTGCRRLEGETRSITVYLKINASYFAVSKLFT